METDRLKPVLGSPKSAKELLDMYFLEMRSALLETAAAFDRIERAAGGTEIFKDPRFDNLRQACDIVKNGEHSRAEQFQILFSDLT